MICKRSTDDPTIVYAEHPELPKGSGTFVLKRLTVSDQIDLGIRKAAFLGSNGAGSPEHAALAKALALCLTSFKSVPDGFNAAEILDADLILALSGEVEAFQASFRRPV